MKKITSILVMLFVMLFAINVKAGSIDEIYSTIYKVDSNGINDGNLYNSMPTAIKKGDTVSVAYALHNAGGLEISDGVLLLVWDDAFELVETNGKYYIPKNDNLTQMTFEIVGKNRAHFHFSGIDAFSTEDVYVAEFKFKVKSDIEDGEYQIRNEFMNDAIQIYTGDVDEPYATTICYESTLKYLIGNVKLSSNITKEDIENIAGDVYIIGNHMFTRDGSEEYDGTLTTEHIMLASKTIDSNNTEDMKIYLKDIFGDWANAINDQEITPQNEFKIDYIDMIAHYAENGIYTDENEDTILKLVQFNDKQAVVKIETSNERINGIATVSGDTATLVAGGKNYSIKVSSTGVVITTNDTYLVNKNLAKRTNLTLNDYFIEEYADGYYDGYGSAVHYIKSAHSGKYIGDTYELDLLRVSERNARICIKPIGEEVCVIDKYIESNEGQFYYYGSEETTYAVHIDDAIYGLKWTNNQMRVICLEGECETDYLKTFTKDTKEMTIEDALNIWEYNDLKYRFTFDPDYDDDDAYFPVFVSSGKPVTSFEQWEYLRHEHYKENVMFIEWRENNQPYDFNTPVTKPTTIVAAYAPLPGSPTLTIAPQGEGHYYYNYDSEYDVFFYSLTVTLDEEYDGYAIYQVDGGEDPILPLIAKGETVGISLGANLSRMYFARAYRLDGEGEPQFGSNSESILLQPRKYEVQFNSNGGTSVTSQFIPYGEFAVEPTGDEIPEKTGFEFIEWRTVDGDPFDFENTRINEPITLYAAWKNNIPTPVVAVAYGFDAYENDFYLGNLNGTPPEYDDKYCTNVTDECSGSEDHYNITGFELYEVVSNGYSRITIGGQYQFAPYEYAQFIAEPNESKQYVLRAYIKEGATTAYSEYSEPYTIDTTLQTPTIAFRPNYGMPDPTTYEAETWIEVTNLMSAFGFACEITTCLDYNVDQFELYERNGQEEESLGTFGPTGAIHVHANYGETHHYFVRGYKTNSLNVPVYSPYSAELVYSPTLPAPTIFRSRIGVGGETGELGYQPLRYNDDESKYEVDFGSDSEPFIACNPQDDTDCVTIATDLEWFTKNGNLEASLGTGGLAGENTILFAEGTSTNIIAKAYVERQSGNYYGPQSNQITIDLTNPTYTFETEELESDNTKVKVKMFVNDYKVQVLGITVGAVDYTDEGLDLEFFTIDKSVLENVDSITLKLSDNKSEVAVRAN